MTGQQPPVSFGSADIQTVRSSAAPSQKELLKADKKEIKRLERKKKKHGKLSKEENIAIDQLYTKRKNSKKSFTTEKSEDKETAEEEVPSANDIDVIHDDFDEDFDYNAIQPVFVGERKVLDYLAFNFEEKIKADMKDLDPHDDFDYNTVKTFFKTDGVIDYYAPVDYINTDNQAITGYIWFHFGILKLNVEICKLS